MTYHQFRINMRNQKPEEVVFIVHKRRGGKPIMMGKQSYENGKAHINRDGWRLATQEEIAQHYKEVVESPEMPDNAPENPVPAKDKPKVTRRAKRSAKQEEE